MGTTALHLPTDFDQDLQARDKRYWEDATAMVIRPKAEGAEGVRALVEHLAPQYGVAPELARAVAETESNFNPRALSRAGAQGVMQLMPGTAQRYQVSDPWNPEDNIRGGLKYLAKLQQQFPGRIDLQLAAYNAGEGAVTKYGNAIPPYPETQDYVQKVQAKLAGTPYTSRGAPPLDQSMVGAAMAAPTPEAPAPEWTASRRPNEPPLEEPIGQRLGPRLATGALGTIETGLKGIEPLEKQMGLNTGLGALATATAQDLHDYVTAKIAPTGAAHTPLDTTAEALGQALPFFVPGMATEAMVSRMAVAAPKIATALGYTTAGVLQGISAAGGTYDALKPLVGEEEAAKRASHAFATNTLLGTVGSALGIFNRGVPEGLARVVMGAVSQGTQGGIGYDLNRREFWVDANAPNAAALKAQGWEQDGDRVVQPYRFRNQLEAAVVQSVVGGAFSGMQELSKLPLPTALEPYAQDPGFTAQRAVEAALMPGMPPTTVPPATWQRWGQAVLNLLPEAGTGGLVQQILGSERGSTGGPAKVPTLQTGAEGLTPERYRTEAGQWRIPLRDMPSQELELQDFIRQQGKINLRNETDVPGDLRALIAPAEVGREHSLQNDRSGLSLQEMASRAAEQGFLARADKENLLWALNRSIAQGQNVYSQNATGHVPLLDSPHVEAAYRHTLDAIQSLEARTEIQTRGVRHHADVMAQAQEMVARGHWTLDDVRDILPGTAGNDTMLGRVLLSVAGLAEQLQTAAQHVVESGGHPASPQVLDYLTIKSMFAEILPARAGVVAEAGRALSFLNEPASAYNRYLGDLHQVMTDQQGGRSVLSMARADLAIATPAERLASEAATQAKVASEQARWQTVNTNMEDWWATYHGELVERPPLFDAPEALAREQQHREAEAQQLRLDASLKDFLDRNALTPYQGDLQEQRLLLSAEEAATAARRAGAPMRWDQFFQAHGVEFKARLEPPPGTEQGLLLNPADYPQVPGSNVLALTQANLALARPGFAAMLVEQYTAAKLGPRSWIKNAVGNTVYGIYAFPVRLLAEGISPLRQGVEAAVGAESTPGVMPGETAAMFWGLTQGTRQHWINAVENWRTGESRFGAQGTGKTDVFPKAVTGENVAALGLPIDPNGPTAKAIDFWGEYVGWLSGGRTTHRILNSSDELAKSWNFSIESAALAHAEASRLGLTGQPLVDQIATIMADPTLAARVNEGALDYAVKMTLQQGVPEEGIGALFAKIANKTVGIPGTEQELPWGRLLLPFVKIPVNGAQVVIENSVLALAQRKFYATIAAGGRQADLALAQIVIGSLMMTGMASLVGSQACVGRAPSDPVQRDVFLKEHPEYSCKIAGEWRSYDWFEPIANELKMVADVAQLMGELKGEGAAKLTAALFFGINKNIWMQTAAKSLTDFFSAMQPGRGDESADQILSNLQRFARQQVGSAVGSWATTGAVRAVDPETKAIRTMIDAVYAQFPWGATTVPRERSLNGEAHLYGLGVGPDLVRPLVRALLPGKWQDSSLGPADKAIKDNDMQLRAAPATLDREAMPMAKDGKTIAPTADEAASLKGLAPTVLSARDYEQYQVIRALNEPEVRKLVGWQPGDPNVLPHQAIVMATQRVALSQAHEAPPREAMSVGEMLDWLTTTARFQAASGGRGGGKEKMFQIAVQEYGAIGKAVFLQLRPDLAEQHLQTEVLHKSRLHPPAEQGPRGLMEEGRLRGRAAMERQYLGFPTTTRPAVGGNTP